MKKFIVLVTVYVCSTFYDDMKFEIIADSKSELMDMFKSNKKFKLISILSEED